MSIAELLSKFEPTKGIKTLESSDITICETPKKCETLYNTSIQFSYDPLGNLTEIKITGTTTSEETITYKKTITYDANGNITQISNWQKI